MLLVALCALNDARRHCAEHYRALMAARTMAVANRIRRSEQLRVHPDRGGDTKAASWLNLCHDMRKKHGPIQVKTVEMAFRERTRMVPNLTISALLQKVPRNELGEVGTEGHVWMDALVALAKGRPVQLRIREFNAKHNYSALYEIVDELHICDLEDDTARAVAHRVASDHRFRGHLRLRPTASIPCPLSIARGRIRHCAYFVFDRRRAPEGQCVELRLDPISVYRFDQRLMQKVTSAIIQTRQIVCGAATVLVYMTRHVRRKKLHKE